MATANELMERGRGLAGKYTEDELRAALKNAIASGDNEERLALQFALKQKTNTTDGYKFTKEAQQEIDTKLPL